MVTHFVDSQRSKAKALAQLHLTSTPHGKNAALYSNYYN